jgi:glyceraldehyde 3-phosphate dehydrogenase
VGRFDGLAMRAPVADGSVVDMTLELDRDTSVEEINALVERAAAGPMRGIVQYSEAPIVSSDIIGNSHSSIFDAPLTQLLGGNLAKVVAWYDNEWGYSSRVEELIVWLARIDGLAVEQP